MSSIFKINELIEKKTQLICSMKSIDAIRAIIDSSDFTKLKAFLCDSCNERPTEERQIKGDRRLYTCYCKKCDKGKLEFYRSKWGARYQWNTNNFKNTSLIDYGWFINGNNTDNAIQELTTIRNGLETLKSIGKIEAQIATLERRPFDRVNQIKIDALCKIAVLGVRIAIIERGKSFE